MENKIKFLRQVAALDGLIKIFESESRDFTQSEIIESIHILKTTVNS